MIQLTARRSSRNLCFLILLLTFGFAQFADGQASTSAAQQAAAQIPPAPAPPSRNEAGRPFIRNYEAREYQAHSQNWSILQDQRGVMYFGNSIGVLEYDGSTWRLIQMPKDNLGRSMALDEEGRVYIGAYDDLGYLAPDATGTKQFVSLVDKIPAEHRAFGDVNKTLSTKQGVYYQTPSHLIRWANGEMRVWKPAEGFLGFDIDGDQALAVLKGVGLTRFDGENFVPLPGGAELLDKGAVGMMRLADGRTLIATRRRGLFVYDGTSIKTFKTTITNFGDGSIYRIHRLRNGTFALCSPQGGIAIIDQNGKVLSHLDKSSGLLTNSVYDVFDDRQGALWAATERGISHIETPSPISILGESSGIDGTIYDISRFNRTLYFSTNLGVFRQKASVDTTGSASGGTVDKVFERLPGLANQAWAFAVADGAGRGRPELFAATGEGLFRIEGNQVSAVIPSVLGSYRALGLHAYRRDPSRIFVTLVDGAASVKFDGSKWVSDGRFADITDSVWSVSEDKNGAIWLGTSTTGLIKLEFPTITQDGKEAIDYAHPRMTRYGTQHGSPDSTIKALELGGQPYFGTSKGLYRFDSARNSFVPDTTFNKVGVSGDPNEQVLREDSQGNVWIHLGKEVALALRQPDGSYTIEKRPFLRFSELNVVGIFPEANGVTWFGGADGLIRYDANLKKDYDTDFTALIRRVGGLGDKILFGGSTTPDNAGAPQLPYAENSVRFEFAAPSFDDENANQYQHLLEGFEKDWSEWSRERSKDYTNLPLGDYRFRLRAKNLYGHVGQEAVYEFKILAPWYRTWFAYLGYVGLFGLAIFGVDRLQRFRLITRERQRSQVREAQLRAEAAEALAKSETERKKNVELLSAIGREITASLDFDTIFVKLYEHVNQLADAAIFGVGLFDSDKQSIDYRLAIENGKRYAPYSRDLRDKNQFPVWCIENAKPVFINDVSQEYSKYLEKYEEPERLLEDGSRSKAPQSIICLPLATKEKVLGIITIQSFHKNAYTEFHLNLLQNLAAYTSIALDNAAAYKQLNEKESEIRQRAAELATVNSVSEALASKLEVDAVIKLVGDKVREVFDAQIAFVAMLGQGNEDDPFRVWLW